MDEHPSYKSRPVTGSEPSARSTEDRSRGGVGPLAVDLITGGWCSASCLLAVGDESDCECACRGIYHGRLAHSRIGRPTTPQGEAASYPEPAPSITPRRVDDLELLGDVFDVMAAYGIDTVRCAQLASSLRGLHPVKYEGLIGKDLRARLLATGVRVPTTDNIYPVCRGDVGEVAARLRGGVVDVGGRL